MIRALLTLLLVSPCFAASLLTFDPARRIPFDANFALNTFHWDAAPDTNWVRVFDVLNNVLSQYDETQGSAHASWNEAHTTMTHGQHQTVAILDAGQHGALVADTVATYAPCVNILIVPTTYGDADVAAKILALPESVGGVCMSFGYTSSKPPTLTLNAMRARTNILFSLAALNGFGSEDNSRDWLCLANLPNAVCVTASTHGDEIFGAYGSNVTLAAAGRRVPADDSEFPFPAAIKSTEEVVGEPRALWSVTGTSLAAPRVAAAAALVSEKFPLDTPPQIAARLCAGANKTPYWLGLTRCGSLNVARSLNAPRLQMTLGGLIAPAGVIFTATMPDGPWTPWLTNLSDGLIPVSLNETQRFWKL